jgi:hypothetical protein
VLLPVLVWILVLLLLLPLLVVVTTDIVDVEQVATKTLVHGNICTSHYYAIVLSGIRTSRVQFVG